MPSSFRDPKTLADWIQLDYFRKPGRVWQVRNLLSWLTFITFLALVAFSWWPRNRIVYESRPVSNAHAMFNENCGVCHVEAFRTPLRLVRTDSSVRSVADDTCRTCHHVGPHQVFVSEPNCPSCHQEHRGRPVLAAVADSQCTVCHADLNAVRPARKGPSARIHSFTADHPPFGASRGEVLDPGTVRFNHKVHLSLNAESLRGIDKPLAALREEQCQYCHQPDPAGRYMKPIRYEQHCKPCHALSVGIAGSVSEGKLRAAAERFAHEPAPHTDPFTVRATLRERYTRFAQENPEALGPPEPTEPPRWIPSQPRSQTVTDKEWLWVNDQLQKAEQMVFAGANGCIYCHKKDGSRGAGNLPQYLPSQITAVWFPHSVFNHARHRMLDCGECHPAESSSDTKDVLVPTIDSCKQCHNTQVGAHTDCAECHRYHDRSKELFAGQKSIMECIEKQ
jgi:hypothetical protein